jgi:uncharacterized RDD family membrane protein YckC
MRWYYGRDGQTRGPVEETTLEMLELSGDIEWTTPVWREGMADWQPLGEIFGRPSVQCHECKRTVDKEVTIHYRDLWICARCKDSFFRQVLDGTASEEAKEYAGFWVRLCARLVDSLFLGIFTIPLTLVNESLAIRMIRSASSRDVARFEDFPELGTYLTLQAVFVLVSVALAIGYEVFFVGRFAGTPGKLLLGVRVVRSDFSRVTYWRATVRVFGRMLSDLTLYIGYLMVLFDPQRRALHDYIADTRVIKREQAASAVRD